MPLSPIPEILEELRQGRIVVLVDDEQRENEGDFICAAEKVTPEIINFMTRVGGGYLCVSMTSEDCERLDLVPQAAVNTSLRGTPFTVSVDGHPRHGVSTGISASDRVKTIKLMIDESSSPDDFVRPGHINPLRARDGGVLVRTGQTEGSVDLVRLAGMKSAALLIEVVREDGEMARMPELEQICVEHELKMCSVEQVIEFRLEQESLVKRLDPIEGTVITTSEGDFTLHAWQSSIDPQPHIALTVGDIGRIDANGNPVRIEEPVLTRMHRRDLLGDVFGVRHDGQQDEHGMNLLRSSMRMIQEQGAGVLVYLRPEGSGNDLASKLLQIQRPAGDDVNAPDLTRIDGVGGRVQPMGHREFGIGSQILNDLGLTKLKLISNRPRPLPGLSGFGLEITEHVPISTDD